MELGFYWVRSTHMQEDGIPNEIEVGRFVEGNMWKVCGWTDAIEASKMEVLSDRFVPPEPPAKKG